MDPNPKSFPVLSYVLTRLNSITIRNPNPDTTVDDVEQPSLRQSPRWTEDQVELVSRMPHLRHPDLVESMTLAITDVAKTRSILRSLGSRPDHESVDAARVRISEINAAIDVEIGKILGSGALEEGKEKAVEECRKRREKEKQGPRAVVQLDEMHEAYEGLLKDAEERLLGIYGENTEMVRGEPSSEMNEEVIEILKEALAGNCIEKIQLSGLKLRILPEEFGRVRGLVNLNLSNNRLEGIADSIGNIEQLEVLDLSTNILSSLPDSIGLLLNLKVLNVSGNKLKKLPDSISHCRFLVELDASYNQLTYLPTNVGLELVNLEKLLIHLNKIRSLPTSVCEMVSLRHLDAHFNELHCLPSSIGKLGNLEILDLSSNFSDLTALPDSFGDLANMRELDLNNNQIFVLPDRFGHLTKLEKLNLVQNPLVVPPLDVVNNGIKAVIEFMNNRLANIIAQQEEEKKIAEEAEAVSQSPLSPAAWLTRSTSWIKNNWAASGGIEDELKMFERDAFLNKQL